jgi:hypothetical protein
MAGDAAKPWFAPAGIKTLTRIDADKICSLLMRHGPIRAEHIKVRCYPCQTIRYICFFFFLGRRPVCLDAML